MLVTGSTASHLPRCFFTFRTRSSNAAYLLAGSAFSQLLLRTPVLNVITQLTLLETTRSAVGQRVQNHPTYAIRNVIFNAAQSAVLAPSKETPNLMFNSLQVC